jgi:hypothetical protein
MFYNCSSLVTAPSLPATTLTERFYQCMFYNCSSLVAAPSLPATTLAERCYESMFYGCSRLVTAPALPATTLSDSCYSNMFAVCTSLVNAPTLPSTTLVDWCYYEMFSSCNKLNYIKMLSTDISAFGCLSRWLSNVSSTGTFVKHPDMTSLPTGTSGIPSGWTVVNDGEESVNLITFTIDEIEYQAEEGMTFYDWALSEYYDSSCLLHLNNGCYNFRNDIIEGNVSSDDIIHISYGNIGAPALIKPEIYTNTIIQPISYVIDRSNYEG